MLLEYLRETVFYDLTDNRSPVATFGTWGLFAPDLGLWRQLLTVRPFSPSLEYRAMIQSSHAALAVDR